MLSPKPRRGIPWGRGSKRRLALQRRTSNQVAQSDQAGVLRARAMPQRRLSPFRQAERAWRFSAGGVAVASRASGQRRAASRSPPNMRCPYKGKSTHAPGARRRRFAPRTPCAEIEDAIVLAGAPAMPLSGRRSATHWRQGIGSPALGAATAAFDPCALAPFARLLRAPRLARA